MRKKEEEALAQTGATSKKKVYSLMMIQLRPCGFTKVVCVDISADCLVVGELVVVVMMVDDDIEWHDVDDVLGVVKMMVMMTVTQRERERTRGNKRENTG